MSETLGVAFGGSGAEGIAGIAYVRALEEMGIQIWEHQNHFSVEVNGKDISEANPVFALDEALLLVTEYLMKDNKVQAD